ncbi:hypothetical protein H0H92_007077, partial [Tricholoma furcatifolium]
MPRQGNSEDEDGVDSLPRIKQRNKASGRQRKSVSAQYEDDNSDTNSQIEATPVVDKRKKTVSAKRGASDKENVEKAEAALQRAQKALEKARRIADVNPATDHVSDGPESEDEEDIIFSSS